MFRWSILQKLRKGSEGMWVSKKKWQALEKRVADLEGRVQSQPIRLSENIKTQLGDSDISDISALATLWWMPHFYIL